MKIGLIYHDLVQHAGGPRQVLSLARELKHLGHTVQVYCYRFAPRHCFPDIAAELDIRAVKKLAAPEDFKRRSALFRLARQLRRYYVETRLVALQMEPDLDLVNPHERPAHRTALYFKRKHGSPVVWMFNDPTSWEKVSLNVPCSYWLRVLKDTIMGQEEKRLFVQFDRIAVLDSGVQSILRRCYEIEASVVRTGLDHSRFHPETNGSSVRSLYSVPEESFLVLWTGVFAPHRRLEDLIEAVRIVRKRNHNVHALLVGSPSQAPRYFEFLQCLITSCKLESYVHFAPENISEDVLVEHYRSCDAFVFPNDQQTWGLAPLEAMACGKPVVVSRGAGVHEVLCHEDTALLIPPGKPEAIAEALEKLIIDGAFRARLAQSGYRFVRDTLSWKCYAQQMVALFEAATSEPKTTNT